MDSNASSGPKEERTRSGGGKTAFYESGFQPTDGRNAKLQHLRQLFSANAEPRRFPL